MNTNARAAKVTSSCIASAKPAHMAWPMSPPANRPVTRKPTIRASPILRLRTAFHTMMAAM